MMKDKNAPGGPLVVLENVVKTFQLAGVDVPVLKGVGLRIEHGEFVALQGVSGSGKSTLLNILGLLDRLSSGRYLLQGRDVAGLDDDRLSELRNQLIGFVFQSFYLIPYISALDNVLLPGMYGHEGQRALTQRGRELLSLVGLADRMDFRPAQLSGGQQQRVALARALINEPAMILADEPTGQLDSKTGVEIMELLSTIHQRGACVVVVTHDETTASYANRRVHVVDGGILS